MVTHQSPHARNRRAEHGFTLIELLLSVAIGLLLMSSAVYVAGQVTRASNGLLDGSSAQEEAQYSMDWITASLRSAGSNPYRIQTSACPANGTPFTPLQLDPLATGLSDNVRIKADLNPPDGLLGGLAGACNQADEDITIWLNRGINVVSRTDNNVGGATVPMSDRLISDLRFVYLDNARAVTAVPGQVAYVQVSMTAQTASRDETFRRRLTFTLTSEVRVRLR